MLAERVSLFGPACHNEDQGKEKTWDAAFLPGYAVVPKQMIMKATGVTSCRIESNAEGEVSARLIILLLMIGIRKN